MSILRLIVLFRPDAESGLGFLAHELFVPRGDGFGSLMRLAGGNGQQAEKEAEESVHGKGESISCFFKGSTIL